jgi:anti-sigma regulatory factor (Ser/Thr protein kinase)
VNGVSVPTVIGVQDLLDQSFVEIHFAISSKETAVASAVAMVRRAMEMLALDNDWVARAELCLQEALLNAHFHGNHGDPERTIRVGCILSSEKIELHVEDEGTGYPVNRDYSSVDTMHPRGRGLFLIHQLMDSVALNGAGAHIIMSLLRSQNHGNQHYAG